MSDKEFLLEEPVLTPEQEAELRGETYVSDDDDHDGEQGQAPQKKAEEGSQEEPPTGTPVPYPRFHEVNEKAKAADAAKAAAEAEAQSLREQLAELQKQAPVAQQQQQQPVTVNDVAEYKTARKQLLEEITDHELLGDADRLSEARDRLIDLDYQFTQRKVEEGIRASKIQDQIQNQQIASFRDTVAELEALYPVIDVKNKDHNPELVDYIVEQRDLLVAATKMSEAQALRRATESAMKAFGIQPVGAQAAAPADAKNRNKSDVLRNADAANRQPPQMHAGMGDRAISSSAKSVAKMTDQEFDNLDPDYEKRLRGEA